MRQWMVDVKIMCRQHLIREYREHFTIVGALRKKKRMNGFVDHNCLELSKLQERFDELKAEMLRRGHKPVKQFEVPDTSYLSETIRNAKVDREASLQDLLNQCEHCRKRFLEINKLAIYNL